MKTKPQTSIRILIWTGYILRNRNKNQKRNCGRVSFLVILQEVNLAKLFLGNS